MSVPRPNTAMKFPILDSTSVTQQWTREKQQQSDLPMDKFIAFYCRNTKC